MRLRLQLFICVSVLLLCHTSGIELLDRLPDALKPENYKVKIIVSMEDQTTAYYGSVRIKVYCEKKTKLIIVNQRDLNIDSNSVWVRPYGETNVKNEGLRIIPQEQEEADKYVIEMERELERKQYYEIKIKFAKTFPRNPASKSGFLLIDEYFAFTRINELGAKMVFPCLDQVDMKAKFQIILKHRENVKGLTNAIRASTSQPQNQPNWTVEEFEETDTLSTFSVAFVIVRSLTKPKETIVSSPNVEIRVSTYKESAQDSAGVHEIVCDVFEFFTQIFTLPYSLGKLDVVIATEMSLDSKGHYGFIFMSTSEAMRLIFKQDTREGSSQHPRYEVFSKLCLAISQQWIGNIVTMSNWYETWLPEGFNNFFQVQCVNKFLPELKHRFTDVEMINSFIKLLEMSRMGRYDEISIIRVNPAFSFNQFNEITKTKINFLVRMMDFFMGPDIFKKSINNYLEHFKFSNSKIDDIWNKFTETIENSETEMSEIEADKSKIKKDQILPSPFTIKQIMESWTNQKGTPLLTLTKIEGDNSVTITQEALPLLYEYEVNKNEDRSRQSAKKCWNIPLRFMTNVAKKFGDASVRTWLTCDTDHLKIRIPRLRGDAWYILNMDMKVLVTIDYDKNNWLRIRDALNNDEDYSGLDVIARTQLVSDLFVLAEVGKISYSIVFDTMKYLTQEKEYPPWKVALKEFKKMWTLLLRTDLLVPFEAYVRDILEPIFRKDKYYLMVDFSFKDKEKYQLKLIFMELACKFSMDACKRSSREIRNIWKKNPEEEFSTAIPLHINEMVHCDGVKHGNMLYRRRLRNRYSKWYPETSDYEASIIFTALGCATHSWTLERYLKLGINRKYILDRDSYKVFHSLTTNKKGYRIMKNFLMNNLKKIAKFHNNDVFDKVRYVEALLRVTNTEKDRKELMKFAEDSKRIDMNLPRLHAVEEKAKYNIRWLEDNEKELREYFKVPEQKKSRFFK